MTLCDSPGFKDSNGIEIDIANAYGIYEAIQGCKSLKIVILISKLSVGDRGNYVNELCEMLTRMIDNIKEYLGSFTYVFTKYESSEELQIYGRMANILEIY
jgi:hypothetical protein